MRTTLLALALLLTTQIAFAEISRDQARSLVHTALKARGDKVPADKIQETTDDLPGYYSFGAYDRTDKAMQNVVGWFAVNKRNGQVWETTSCELYQFPSLEKQRRRLVRHAAKGKLKPPCSDGQKVHIVRKRSPHRAAELPETAQ